MNIKKALMASPVKQAIRDDGNGLMVIVSGMESGEYFVRVVVGDSVFLSETVPDEKAVEQVLWDRLCMQSILFEPMQTRYPAPSPIQADFDRLATFSKEEQTRYPAPSPIQADFDRLAAFSKEEWNNNNHYHSFLLRHVPPQCSRALEIGCGGGTFSRLLAARSEQVLALDLSPQMIKVARERSLQYTNIEFQVADALMWDFPRESFDCIVSIATLHHLPLEEMLAKMKGALKVNGVLLVLDLYQKSLSDRFTSLAAFPVSLLLKYFNTGHFREPPEVRAAWEEHIKHDTYLTLSQLRDRCQDILPGVRIRKHLLWRYSLVWQKVATLSY